MTIIRKTDKGTFSKPLFCKECGAILPAEVREAIGHTTVAVFCKKCKTVTEFEIEG